MKWIVIEPAGFSASGKTREWTVLAAEGRTIIGYVRWYPQWRKYAFHPGVCTVFEWDCLRDIADFIAQATVEHYENKKAGKAKNPAQA